VWFILLLPLTRLRARTLFAFAAVCAVLGPVYRFVILNYVGRSNLDSVCGTAHIAFLKCP
jgi:hypothetical protein